MRGNVRRVIRLLLLSTAMMLLMSFGAQAATAGWNKIGKNVYYYEQNEAGKFVKVTGMKKLGRDYYSFNKNGVLVTGWVKGAKGFYYFKRNGSMGNGLGRMFRSQVVGFDNKIYAFGSNGLVMTGFRKISGSYYYFVKTNKAGTNGAAIRNKWYKVAGVNRFFQKNGKMAVSTWVKNTYYVDAEGKLLTNTVTPDGYLVNAKGKKVSKKKANGWVKISGKYKYYSAKQKQFLTEQWLTIGKYKFYVDKDSHATVGWLTLGTDKYYFDKKGHLVTGTLKSGTKTYEFGSDGKFISVKDDVTGTTSTTATTTDTPSASTSSTTTTTTNTTTNATTNTTTNSTTTTTTTTTNKTGKKRVLIIAGHGQGDGGAVGCGFQESLKTREFARLIYNKLKADGKVDVELYKNASLSYDLYQQNASITRTLKSVADTSVSALKTALKRNTNIPTYNDYDFILEVHFNASGYSTKDPNGNGSYKGCGFFYNSGKVDKKLNVEKRVMNGFAGLGFKVWNYYPMDGLLNAKICAKLGVNYTLLETAFIDDKDDMTFYQKNKSKMADVVAASVEAVYGK